MLRNPNYWEKRKEAAGSKKGGKHGFRTEETGQPVEWHGCGRDLSRFLMIAYVVTQNHLFGCVKWVTYGCRKK